MIEEESALLSRKDLAKSAFKLQCDQIIEKARAARNKGSLTDQDELLSIAYTAIVQVECSGAIQLIDELDNIDVQRQLFLRVGALIGFASASQSRSDMSVALADWEAQKRAEKAARPAAAQDAKRQQSKITKEVIDRHAEAWRKRPEHSKQLRDGSIAAGICDEVNAELAAMGLHLKEGTIRKRLKKPDH